MCLLECGGWDWDFYKRVLGCVEKIKGGDRSKSRLRNQETIKKNPFKVDRKLMIRSFSFPFQ